MDLPCLASHLACSALYTCPSLHNALTTRLQERCRLSIQTFFFFQSQKTWSLSSRWKRSCFLQIRCVESNVVFTWSQNTFFVIPCQSSGPPSAICVNMNHILGNKSTGSTGNCNTVSPQDKCSQMLIYIKDSITLNMRDMSAFFFFFFSSLGQFIYRNITKGKENDCIGWLEK